MKMASYSSAFLSRASSYAWPTVVGLSRRAILSLLSRITVGQLVVVDMPTNTVNVCGALEPKQERGHGNLKGSEGIEEEAATVRAPRAELRVQRNVFWVRMLLFADMVRCCSMPLVVGIGKPRPACSAAKRRVLDHCGLG